MGCDIHAAIEYKDEKGWHALMHDNKRFGKFGDEDKQTARLNLNRDYDLFAVLANVRNGRGFAGCLTSTAVDSISDQRGLPEDITTEAQESCWGDHSDTWVSLAGILAFDWTRSTTHYGVVSAREFEQWDRMKEWEPAPRSYCGDVTGGQTKKISPTKMRSHIKETVHFHYTLLLLLQADVGELRAQPIRRRLRSWTRTSTPKFPGRKPTPIPLDRCGRRSSLQCSNSALSTGRIMFGW